MVLTHQDLRFEGLLYPMMVIAAVAVVVFSLLGIASVSGFMPSAIEPSPGQIELSSASTPSEGAFACAECRVIESVQKIELGGSDR